MSITIATITENELLRALTDEIRTEPFDPTTEVTAAMLAKSAGISSRHASAILSKGVEEGRFSVREVRIDGYRAKAYRKK